LFDNFSIEFALYIFILYSLFSRVPGIVTFNHFKKHTDDKVTQIKTIVETGEFIFGKVSPFFFQS